MGSHAKLTARFFFFTQRPMYACVPAESPEVHVKPGGPPVIGFSPPGACFAASFRIHRDALAQVTCVTLGEYDSPPSPPIFQVGPEIGWQILCVEAADAKSTLQCPGVATRAAATTNAA